MRVLVCAASRHHATKEIAARLAAILHAQLVWDDPDAEVDLREPGEVDSLDGYDIVILGSAVYLGRWLDPARRFAAAHAEQMLARPVWLFSSGPVGDPPEPLGEPVDATQIAELVGARGHVLLSGRLNRNSLTKTEKALARVLHASDGDFRDWAEVDTCAVRIYHAIRELAPVPVG